VHDNHDDKNNVTAKPSRIVSFIGGTGVNTIKKQTPKAVAHEQRALQLLEF
jgi:hypothetical protein